MTKLCGLAMAMVALLAPATVHAQAIIVPSPVPAFTAGCFLQYNGTTGLLECTTASGLALPLSDAAALLSDNTTSSKQLRFELSGISASTTRVITVPDANITLPTTFVTLPLADNVALLADNTTPSKQVRFELSNISASTTRVITVPDSDITLGAGGASAPFSDATALVSDNTTPSKLLRFEVSGISASTTRVWTIPDVNLTIPSSFVTLPIADNVVILADNADPTKQLRIDLGTIATGTTRVWTAPDSDVTIGSGGGGGATLSSNTFTGNQTIAKNTPKIIMQDTTSGLGSASVATIEQWDSSNTVQVLQLGNTASGYVILKANAGALSLQGSSGNGIHILGDGTAIFAAVPTWSAGLGAVAGTTGYFSSTLAANSTFTSTATLSSPMIALAPPANVTDGSYIDFKNAAGTVIGSITELAGNASIAFNTTSDQRLKRDLGLATDTTVLRRLAVHSFEWVSDEHTTSLRFEGDTRLPTQTRTIDLGVFAQEAYRVSPRAITPGTDERNPAGGLVRPWQIDYTKFVPNLIVGWQQHQLEIQALRNRIAILEKEP